VPFISVIAARDATKLQTMPDSILHDEIETVDRSDIDRLLAELNKRGGAYAILGRFLQDKLAEYWATLDPESALGEE